MNKIVASALALVICVGAPVGYWQLEDHRQDRIAKAKKVAGQLDEVMLGKSTKPTTYIITDDGDARFENLRSDQFQLFVDDLDSLISYYKLDTSGQCRNLKNGQVCLIAHLGEGDEMVRTLRYTTAPVAEHT